MRTGMANLLLAVTWISALIATVSAQDIYGKWAGYLETPGSLAAMRMNIAPRNPDPGGSRIVMNVYGEETVHPISELKVDRADISFKAEMFKEKFTFSGKLVGNIITGTCEFAVGGRAYTGSWKLRRFDDSKLVKTGLAKAKGKNELVHPTGRFAIGRRTFYWTDDSRPETITDNPNDRRTMFVQLWYPAEKAPRSQTAPYIENLEELYSKAPDLSLLRTIKTHAIENASPAFSKTPFPLIVFAPGLGSSISKYTSVIENLVSHGYAVAAINPGYDAGDFRLPDGRTITYKTELWDRNVSATWSADQRRAFFDERRREWAADMSFVLDKLEKLDANLGGKLDRLNVGALGHSFGGQAVTIGCADDKRFKACANLDGLAQGAAFLPGTTGANLKQPFAFFSKTPVSPDYELTLMGLSRDAYDARERHRMLELWKPSLKARLAALDQGTYFVVVRGATHASFSDGPLLEADPKNETLVDRMSRSEIINEYILGFFDQFLRSNPSRLFKKGDNSRRTVVVELLSK